MPAHRSRRSASPGKKAETPQPLRKQDAEQLKDILLRKRAELAGHVAALQDAAVADHDSTNWEEDGTDAFDREFAFKMAGSKYDAIHAIDDALSRMVDGTYGTCDECGEKIGRERMTALPFCRTCIACQSSAEQGRAPRQVRLPD